MWIRCELAQIMAFASLVAMDPPGVAIVKCHNPACNSNGKRVMV
jgi:hypothetical protein